MAPINENGSNNNIPDDLALNILSKLPLKSLKRFTCVQKSWGLLFDNPNFMSMYRYNFISDSYDDNSYLLLKNRRPSEFIWIFGERSGDKFNLDRLPPPPRHHERGRYFYLLGFGSGIHGTLCICEPYDLPKELVYLWNPATGESLIVPPSSFNFDDASSFFEFNVIHCGFGYDHVTFDYKLIRCVDFLGTNLSDNELDYWNDCRVFLNNIWEIYSVRSNTWRTLNVEVDVAPRDRHNTGNDMYLNGVCYWLSEKKHNETFLVSFNLNTEVVLTTPFPSYLNKSSICCHLGELNGCIALISYRVAENASLDISILGEIGVKESWTKLFTFGPLPSFGIVSGVRKNGDIIFIKINGEIARFNLITETIEVMGVLKGLYKCQFMIYKESFLPIREIHN